MVRLVAFFFAAALVPAHAGETCYTSSKRNDTAAFLALIDKCQGGDRASCLQARAIRVVPILKCVGPDGAERVLDMPGKSTHQ
jgi:hypothetical protein